MTDHEIGDLDRPFRRLLGDARTGDEIIEGDGRLYLGDGRMTRSNMLAAANSNRTTGPSVGTKT
jgi:hypothetical protein